MHANFIGYLTKNTIVILENVDFYFFGYKFLMPLLGLDNAKPAL
jgi:hypothetical protein